jgi:hypothetical protein
MEHFIYTRIKKEISFREEAATYNRRRIFKRAIWIAKNEGKTWAEALKQSWAESKVVVLRSRKEIAKYKESLLNLFTPVQYQHTFEAAQELIHQQYNEGRIKKVY